MTIIKQIFSKQIIMGQPISKPNEKDTLSGSNQIGTYSELLDWNQKELQHSLEHSPFTVEDIRQYYNDNMDGSQRSVDTAHYYSSDGESITGDAQLAIRLLTLSPTLAKLRFRMVPAKISESSFWEAVFGLLKERLSDQQQLAQEQNISASHNSNGYHHEHATLQTAVATKDREIASLQRQVKELKQKLLEQQQQQEESMKNNINLATTSRQEKHKGKWIMNQDSIDFLNYPTEVKTNMRQEKQRRLQQIQNEMKFILDSDHERDSHGYWSCCNATEYQATCSK